MKSLLIWLLKDSTEVSSVVGLSRTFLLHVYGEDFEFLFIWGILDHQQLRSNDLQMIKLS